VLPLFSGHQSVDLFFVLSGFVLSLPYLRGTPTSYLVYCFRRILRVYLPFAVAATFSVIGFRIFLNRSPMLSDWFQNTWHGPFSWGLVVKQFLMRPIETFNTALWSLGFEMNLSLAMPFIAFALRRSNALFVLLVSLAVAFGPSERVFASIPFAGTIHVAGLFVLGGAMAFFESDLRALLRKSRTAALIVLGVSLFVYFDYPLYLLPRHSSAAQFLAPRMMLLSGLGGAGIILCALEISAFAAVLRHGLFEYLGRISFSLYLVHSVVLFAMVDLLNGKMPYPILYALIALGCMLSAHLFCVFVEEPSLQLSRRLKTLGRGRIPLARTADLQ
jgi:peptidoglycan/LPS O-acetylase OafA/YrhL